MHRYHKLINILNNWLRRQLNHMTNYLGEVQIRFYLIAWLFVLEAQPFAGSNKSEYFQQIQLKMLHNSRPDRRMHHHPRPPPFYCLFIDFYATLKVTEPAGTLSLEGCFHCASVWRSLCKCQVMKSECANHGSHPWNIIEKNIFVNLLSPAWCSLSRERRFSFSFRQKPRRNRFENCLKAGNANKKSDHLTLSGARYGCEEPCEKKNEKSGERKYAEITVDLFFLPALAHSLSRSNDNLFHRRILWVITRELSLLCLPMMMMI